MLEQHGSAFQLRYLCRYRQFIVKQGRTPVVDRHVFDYKNNIVFVFQYFLTDTQRTEPFGTCTFVKFQVISVINDTLCISVFIVNPDRPLE